MTTRLLLGSSVLLLLSCTNSSSRPSADGLSDQEMKDLVEVEEIEFDNGEELKDSVTTGPVVSSVSSLNELKDESSENGTHPPLRPTDLCCLGCPIGSRSDTNDFGAHDFPDIGAQYPGGIHEMRNFIANNVRYPHPQDCSQGRVYVTFIVEKDGGLTHAEVMRGGLSPEYNEEALRVIRKMPNWIPAENNGKIVAARVRLPIRFSIN